MLKKRSLLALILSLTLILTTGCSEADPGSVADPAPDDAASASQEEPAEEIELNMMSVWVGKDSKAEVFSQMIASFNEEYAGEINVVVEEQTDYNAYNDKIRGLITTGAAPDLFTLHSTVVVNEFSEGDVLFDFAPYLDDTWKSTFQGGVFDNIEKDGKIQGIPYESAIFPVMYNKEMLASVGYDEFPKTYEELFDCCEKLVAAGITPMSQMTGENAFTTQLWYSQAALAVGGVDVYTRGMEDPAFATAAELVKEMYNYTTTDAIGATAAVAAGHFLNGRTAIFMNGPWFFGRVGTEAAEGIYDNVSLAYPPAYEDGEHGGMASACNAYLVASPTEDQNRADAIVTFMKYITDPTRVAELSKDSGSLFFVKTEPSDDTERLQKELLELANEATYIGPVYYEGATSAQVSEFPQAIAAVVLDEMTAEEFATKIANTD